LVNKSDALFLFTQDLAGKLLYALQDKDKPPLIVTICTGDRWVTNLKPLIRGEKTPRRYLIISLSTIDPTKVRMDPETASVSVYESTKWEGAENLISGKPFLVPNADLFTTSKEACFGYLDPSKQSNKRNIDIWVGTQIVSISKTYKEIFLDPIYKALVTELSTTQPESIIPTVEQSSITQTQTRQQEQPLVLVLKLLKTKLLELANALNKSR
jgi:hypothetical protein